MANNTVNIAIVPQTTVTASIAGNPTIAIATAPNAKMVNDYNDLNNKPKINGTELIGNLDILDTTVKLGTDLKTYYNIGKIQTASGTNPVLVGHAGDTLRDVFNAIMTMEELQPTITAQPAISALNLSSSASDELGTEINQINYSLSTNPGSYTYGPATGVTWSKFEFTGDCSAAEKTTVTGTLQLTTPYVVGTSGTITVDCAGTHSEGAVAITNLGNPSNPEIKIAAGTKNRAATFSKAAVAYPYYTSSASTAAPTTGTKGVISIETAAGASISYTAQQYLWILSATNSSSKKIQIYSDIAKTWSDMLGGTEAPISVTFTMANGKTRTYYAYRTTNIAQSSGSATIRLI